ncbi:MAG: hypothetical protein ACJ79S_01205 [Gemmatimonadaceae bacterium]
MSDAVAPPPTAPTRGRRALVALLAGLWGGALCLAMLLLLPDKMAGDVTTTYRAAVALLHGLDPYTVVVARAYPFDQDWFYPLPAAFVLLPLTPFSYHVAGALFFTISCALLGYTVTRDGYERLPLFFSVPFLFAAHGAQWAPFIMAASAFPGIARGLLVVKPNLGLAAFAARPTGGAVLGALALVVAGVALVPAWPLEWLHNARSSPYAKIPIATLLGPLLLLAALRWRTPEGRLLLAMACIPQFPFFYDALPLWLVARTQREALNLTWCSWAAFAGWLAFSFDWTTRNVLMPTALPWVVALIYLPALVIVLRHRPAAGTSRPRRSYDSQPNPTEVSPT